MKKENGFEGIMGTIVQSYPENQLSAEEVSKALEDMQSKGTITSSTPIPDQMILLNGYFAKEKSPEREMGIKKLFNKFILGEYTLLKTFWVFNIIPLYGLTSLSNVTNGWSEIVLVLYLPLSGISLWRAASKYSGTKLWKILAKIVSILFMLLLPTFIIAYLI